MCMLSISCIRLVYVCYLVVKVRLEYIIMGMVEGEFRVLVGGMEFV